MTDSDTAFLTALGHRIVASPAAYALIDDETLLFAVHLYRPIYAAALQSCLPAIFVGTGWDVWDTYVSFFFFPRFARRGGFESTQPFRLPFKTDKVQNMLGGANMAAQGHNRRCA